MPLKYFLLILLIGALWSCSKETYDHPPTVTIHAPVNGTTVSYPDSLLVDATITDDIAITSVKVVLNNSDLIPALEPMYFYPASKSFTLHTFYPVNQNSLEEGTYHLLVRAEDQNDFTNEYRQVKIGTNPPEEDHLIVITQPEMHLLKVNLLDANGNTSSSFLVEGDYAHSAINTAGKLLFLAGKNDFNLRAYDLTTNQMLWEKESYPWDPMHNSECLYFNDYLYITYRSYYIQGIKSSGAIIFTTETENPESPEEIKAIQSHLLVDMQMKNGGTPSLVVYNRETGIEKQRKLTNFDIKGFHEINNDKVLITANAENTGEIYEYNIGANYLYQWNGSLPEILCSEKITSETILLGTTNGISQYNTITHAYTELLGGKIARHLLFDQATGQLIFSSNDTVFVYSYPEIKNQKTLPFSDFILNLHLQFYKKQ